jgi:hypothetical protein
MSKLNQVSLMSSSLLHAIGIGTLLEYHTDRQRLKGIFLFHPTIPGYPNA